MEGPEPDDDTGLRWLAENWDVCVARYGEEGVGLLVDRLPGITRCWDRRRPWGPHFGACMRWYRFKQANKERRVMEQLAERGYVESSDALEVRDVLERIGPAHAQVLYVRFVLGYTFKRMSEVYGVSQGTAFNYVERALLEARRSCAAGPPEEVPGQET